MGFFDGGFGSLAGGILGSIGSVMNNKTQLKIARETNAMNRQMFDDQLAYNTEMWNKQNEYNDPLAQRERLENAGLNPLFHGLDGTGNASGWQSATPIPAQGASVENPLVGLAAGIAGMGDARLKESQKENTDSKTVTENLLRSGMLESQHVQIRLFEGQVKLTAAQEKQVTRSIDQMDTQLSNMSRQLDIQSRSVDLEERRIDIEDFKSKVYAADIKSTIAKRNKDMEKIDNDIWVAGQQISIAYAELANKSRELDIAQQNADTNSRNADINQQNANTNSYNAETNRLVANSTIQLNGRQMELIAVKTEQGKHEIKLIDAKTETEVARKGLVEAETLLTEAKTINEAFKVADTILDTLFPFNPL